MRFHHRHPFASTCAVVLVSGTNTAVLLCCLSCLDSVAFIGPYYLYIGGLNTDGLKKFHRILWYAHKNSNKNEPTG